MDFEPQSTNQQKSSEKMQWDTFLDTIAKIVQVKHSEQVITELQLSVCRDKISMLYCGIMSFESLINSGPITNVRNLKDAKTDMNNLGLSFKGKKIKYLKVEIPLDFAEKLKSLRLRDNSSKVFKVCKHK